MPLRRLASRLLLALGAILVTLTVLELLLRLAPSLMPGPRGGKDAAFTILCVGDSHTYGLNLPPNAAYPARLQELLDPTGTTIGVKNYGVPGRNSGALLRELPRYLDETRPDVVLLLIGFNDAWNFDAAADAADGGPGPIARFFRDLRLARMARLLAFRDAGGAPPQMIVENGRTFVVENGEKRPAGMGGEKFGVLAGERLAARVTENVARIAEMTRARGARLVVLDYATESQATFVALNAALADAAGHAGVPFCELAVPFRDAIARQGFDSLFFPDGHPTANGYALIAELVADRLHALDVLPAVATASAPTRPDLPEPTLAVVRDTRDGRDGAGWIAVVHGTASCDVQVVLSAVRSPPVKLGAIEIPIGRDPLLDRSAMAPALRARLDASGDARIALPTEVIGDERGRELFALAALYPGPGATGIPRLSQVVAFGP